MPGVFPARPVHDRTLEVTGIAGLFPVLDRPPEELLKMPPLADEISNALLPRHRARMMGSA